jgi:hypothetical protein
MGWNGSDPPSEHDRRLRQEALMSVLLALAAFPILAVLLMALSRAEESLSHEVERDPLAR